MCIGNYQRIQAILVIFLFCLLLGSAPVFGEDNMKDKVCQEMDTYAYNVMNGRQNGVAQAKMYGIIDQSTAPGDIKALLIAIIDDAYKSPYYHTESMKQHAITEFRNQVFQSCVDNL